MISDNKDHITYSAEDIQRYWNGQLSPQEMHAMEKAALDDPFLADAMEGMGDALREHDEQLVNTELTTLHRQLRSRVNTQDRPGRVVSFAWWKVAAVAVVVLVAGFWIFDSSKQRLDKTVISKLEENDKKENAAELKVTHDSAVAPVEVPIDSPEAPPPQTLSRSQSAERRQPEPGLSDFNTKEFPKKNHRFCLCNPEVEKRQESQTKPVKKYRYC